MTVKLLAVLLLCSEFLGAQAARMPGSGPAGSELRILLGASDDSADEDSKGLTTRLEARIVEIARARRWRLGKLRVQRFFVADAPKEGLPAPESWDLAVLLPGPLLDQAAAAGRLAAFGERHLLLVDVAAYGLFAASDPLRPLPWTALGDGKRLMVPDLAREPGFFDVLAELMRGRAGRAFRLRWTGVQATATTSEMRALARRASSSKGVEMILRLRPVEIPAFEDLPTLRLGLAVSGQAQPYVQDLARALAEPPQIEAWLGHRPLQRRFASRLRRVPTPSEVREARDFVFGTGGLFGRGLTSKSMPDWLTNLFLTVFALGFGVILLRASRKRAKRISGNR